MKSWEKRKEIREVIIEDGWSSFIFCLVIECILQGLGSFSLETIYTTVDFSLANAKLALESVQQVSFSKKISKVKKRKQ